jgi:hypothetical protein
MADSAPAGPRRSRRFLRLSALVLAAGAALYCLPSRAKLAEIRGTRHLLEIRRAEEAYFAAHGTYLAAGPVPERLAYGDLEAVKFVQDGGFATLGFKPFLSVVFSYAVRVSAPHAAVITATAMTDCCSGSTLELRLKLGPGESEVVEVVPHYRGE